MAGIVIPLSLVGLGQVSAPAAPVLFAPGVVSTAAPEFAVAFSPDGRTVYFNRAEEDRSRFTLHSAQLLRAGWVPSATPPLAGRYSDLDPFITANGSRLYFSSNRPETFGGPARPDYDLWVADLGAAGWGPPTRVGPGINSDRADVFCSLTTTGDLYFASDRSGTMAIYAALAGPKGTFQPPQRLALDLPPMTGPINPLISSDGRTLIFASAAPESFGGLDLYAATRTDEGRWSAPRNLGPRVNSAFADFAPAWGPDGETLYFTSERPGVAPARTDGGRPPGDIYSVAVSVLGLALK